MTRFNFPALLSFLCGFVSLSFEILWVRLYGFAHNSTPLAFGFVLAAYLFGIAIGAYTGGRSCRRESVELVLWRRISKALIYSSAITLIAPLLYVNLVRLNVDSPPVDLMIISVCSAMLAYIFPIAHHLGSNKNQLDKGKKFALVYTANVMGASLGPLVTGYILLDIFTLQECIFILALIQVVSAIGFAIAKDAWDRKRVLISLGIFFGGLIVIFMQVMSPHKLIEEVSAMETAPKKVVENRQGIISIFGDDYDDIIFGGNVYDGRTNLSVELNSNGLHRPILLAALQPKPKRVLMIGLSVGTWLALVNGFEGVEHVDVIEINPGYLEVAQSYANQGNAIRDARVNVVIGDGRRWLRLHAKEKYDLVVMNTTWHWRSNSSLMLSADFLNILKSNMADNAILAFNATGSVDAFYTATKVFKHAYRYDNFVYASNFDFRPLKNSEEARQSLRNIRIAGEGIFPNDSPLIDVFLSKSFVPIEVARSAVDRDPEIITDNNMITEFKFGRRLN